VRQISCSQCGAPIDLEKDSACTHCGAPIALIDPEGVAKALQDLATARNATAPDEREAHRAALTDAQIKAIFDLERMREREGDREQDLLAVGLAAAGVWLATRFL
jgi:predicted amidophosphoribosyltransferase